MKYANMGSACKPHCFSQQDSLSICGRSHLRLGAILFTVALVVRLTILALFEHNYMPPDGTGYHRLAVNLAKGNGLSLQENEPFEKSFIREPGYPIFLAGIYSVVNLVHPIENIQNYDIKTGRLNRCYPEIVIAKIVQAVIDSISVVLLFIILMAIANMEIAFLTGLVTSLFVNYAFYSVYILRETLVVFLLLILNIFYLKYLRDANKLIWLLCVGITIGILILVFQVHIAIIPVLFILMLIQSRRLGQSVCHITFVFVVAVSITIPHCINAYRFYPDIRVVKTFGTSLTHEQMAYTGAILRAQYYGLLTKEEGDKRQDWCNNSREQFKKSFNGYYLNAAASLNALTPEGVFSERKIKNLLWKGARSLFLPNIGKNSARDIQATHGVFVSVLLMLIPGLIGFIGALGVIFCGRQKLAFLLPFVAYSLLFWVLGSECRRMIILQPFLIFFGLLFLKERVGVTFFSTLKCKSYNH
jgi:hypothetical protein